MPQSSEGPRCIRSDDFKVIEAECLRSKWDLSLCSLANSIDERIIVFKRSLDYAVINCCNLIIPLGWGDDFVLLDYLPVSGYKEGSNFSKRRRYVVDIAAPTKYDIEPYENPYGVLVVNVRQGRTIFSGELVRVEDFSMGNLQVIVDASKTSGANYKDFLQDLHTIEQDDNRVAVMRPMEPIRTETVLDDSYTEYDGFVKL